jgi:septum formation protein
MRLVLASTSRYRRELLTRLGLPFEAVAPRYAEEHDLDPDPERLVVELAARKAESLAADFPDALIVGSDQVAAIDGEILTKPGTAERALAQLERLAGREHRLLTGLVVLEPRTGRSERTLDIHTLRLRALSRTQLQRYIEVESPLDCAGSYKIEGRGIALFESMRGDDYTGIVGLPLTRLVELLGRFGVEWPPG